MSTPQEFLDKVVAWPGLDGPGYINLHWKGRGPGMPGKPFKELHEFMNFAQYAATKPSIYKEIYFCLSTQSAVGKTINGNVMAARHAPMAIRLKAIWLDVDVKPDRPDKAYKTIQEALNGIETFYRAAKLPPPSALVLSGGGVHVYWISDKALEPKDWRPYAEGLKAEALRLGLKCDAGITADAARVLRVPGTSNNKTVPPRPVRVAHLGDCYDFATTLQHLADLIPAPAITVAVSGNHTILPFDLSAFEGKPVPANLLAGLPEPQFDSLAEGINIHGDLPLKLDQVIRGCTHYRECGVTHGKGHAEPLWQLTLLGATWFEDGRTWAHHFSKGYPTYSKGETDEKFDQKLTARENGTGWPSCRAFEAAGAKCKACPYYGKIRSPLNLAERVQPPQITIGELPPPSDDLKLPPPYTVNEKGWICEMVKKQLHNGVEALEIQPLFMCKLRNPVLQRGTRKINFETSLDGDRWGPVSIYETDLATEQTLIKALRSFGVKPFVRNQRGIAQFMTSWTEKLDAADQRIDTVPFGWLYSADGGEIPVGFAYGGRVVRSDGTVQLSGYSDAQLEAAYKPKGDPQVWWDALHMVTEQCYIPLEVLIAMSFGAPLMIATGIYNAIMCGYSHGAGTHKSTSIHIGCAVWGSPQITKERPATSQKGLLRKLGHVQNLPVYWDEVSDEDKMDKVRGCLNEASEGGGGSKLHTDRTFFDYEKWQTAVGVGANLSLVENIMKNVDGTDAQLKRVFEFFVERRPDSRKQEEVSRMIRALDHNYGHMGLLYSEMLGRDPKGIIDWVFSMVTKFNNEVEHKSQERFQAALAATTYCGAVLANQLGCNFHTKEMWDWLKERYQDQREFLDMKPMIAGTAPHTAETIGQFFKWCVLNTLWVQAMPVAKKGHPEAIAWLAGPSGTGRVAPIHIRCSINERVIDISRAHLMKYLATIKSMPAAVTKGLVTHYGATVVHKVDLSVGSGIGGARETVYRIPVPDNSPFLSFLYRALTIQDRPVSTEDEKVTGITAAVTQAAADNAVVMGMTGMTGMTGPAA